jgi:two-component system, OmpR family, sensor histidine kinase VicK
VSDIFLSGGKLFKGLQWKIIFIYLMLILLSLQLISVYLIQSLEQYYLRNFKESFENQARLLAIFMQPSLGEGQAWAEDTVRLAREFRDLYSMEIIILDSFASVVGTSGSQSLIGQRLIRDEITRALAGHMSDIIRFDPVNQERRYYLAFPVISENNTIGVIYLSGSLKAVDSTLNEVKAILLTGVLLALLVCFFLGVVLTKTITAPIQEVTDQANSMALGDYTRSIKVRAADEIGQLGESFNYLAEQLSQTIDEMSSEKSKVEAIINNMTDGVIALDGKGYVIQINPSSRSLIKAMALPVPTMGRTGFTLLRKLIGPDQLRQFLRSQEPCVAELSEQTGNYTVQVKIAPFKIEKGKLNGTLIVLHDITREREFIKRQEEFVADVSHELRTPLSTLKSYLETLLDGAAEDPQVRQRFLKILSAETDRMVTMVKDLLTLSQMDAEKVDWQRSAVNLEALAREAVDNLEQKFGSKLPAIKFNFTSGEIMAYVDRDQVSRVFTNLLNNAARFTTEDGEIVIGAKPDDSFVVVSIRDTGIGIPESELPRLFERFYRVEKTRSRDFGGTGLGLSIARKIVEGHGGSIWVESTSGSGTSVYFSLPGYRLDEVNEQ